MPDGAQRGLRERKKLKTRATLIQVAADLCQRQGYDNTTVEQIAAAAEVSPRTFSRYFPTKGDVVAAIVDDMDDYVADALRRQPAGITHHEALLLAHLEIFAPCADGDPPAFTRMAVLISIVNGATSINTSAFAFRQRFVGPSIDVLAERMGVPADHRSVRLVADIWTLVFSSSFAGLGLPGEDPIEARTLCDRLSATFELFRQSWQPQPPASGPQR